MPVAHLNGIDINYEVHGDGTPLVLTHGYSATLEMWREQVPAFSAKYRLVIYDSRGHGKTTAPSDMNAYDLARDYVADKLALMDHLGIDKAHAGGLSMGGMVAQEFALQHPDRVKALLLFDTGPGMSAMAQDPARMAQFTKMREMMQTVARTKGMSPIIDAMRNSPMTLSPRATGAAIPEAARRHIENMKQMSVDGYLGGSKAMQDWGGSLDRLHQITAPALVLVGEQDHLLAASRAIHGKIAGSRFVVLRNSGHGTNIWRSGAFIEQTLDFLAAVDAGQPVDGEVVVP
jgi:pimeloyl-ACP methyl ester carboxylesterase